MIDKADKVPGLMLLTCRERGKKNTEVNMPLNKTVASYVM